MPVKVLIVDDHPVLRRGLRDLIEGAGDLVVCGEAASAPEALRKLREAPPDVATIDISLQSGHGIELIKQVRHEFPGVKMLVVSMYEEALFAERALHAGASGYVNKQEALDSIVDAIRRVLAGGIFLSQEMTERTLKRAFGRAIPVDASSCAGALSDRETEVFQLIGEGLTSREMAKTLGLSIKTINTHRENIKTKLGLRSAAELTRAAVVRTLERG